MGKSIGIIAIKGGVGKTTTVAALGAALTQFGKKTLIVDANFSAPNLGLHVGIVEPDVTLHHVLTNKAQIQDAIYKTEYGFDIIPGALMHDGVDPLRLKAKLNMIKNEYDVVVIDSSPTLNNEILATMVASDQLFVVTTPDHVTLSTTLRAVRLAKEKKTPIHGLILNKVYNQKFELSLEDIEETADCSVMAVLPHDVNILAALSETIPATAHKEHDVAVEYKKLAGALIGEEYKDGRLWKRMKGMFSSPPKQEVNRTVFKDTQ